jgi:DNA-binding LacI/PurR family transcriptional regulator
LIYFSNFNDIIPKKNRKKIDGLIISSFPHLEYKIQEVKKFIPVVLMDNSSPDKSIPSVIIDNFNGVFNAINYLCTLGHKRIGFIAGMLDSDVGKNRLIGYKSALISHGIDVDQELIYKGNYFYKSGESGANYLLSLNKPPTAIMCSNDQMAVGVIKSIREKGLSVPDDISVIGFDDIGVASLVHPPLTTVAAPIKKIAKRSVNLLISLLNGVDCSYKSVIIPTKFVERDSCAAIMN